MTLCSTRSAVVATGAHRDLRPGSCRNASASVAIVAGIVAEKNSVWRSRRQQLHDPPHVVDEAHVEHAVGLVEDEDLDVAQATACAWSMRSSRRPGVATRMSTPRASARSCLPIGDAAEDDRGATAAGAAP